MKNKLYVLIISTLILALFYKAESQTQDCSSKTFTGSYFDIPQSSSFPEYELNMPYEVLLGYVALDTVCYYGDWDEYVDFMSRQEYNDTLKTLIKHYYHVVDWDPLKFMQSEYYLDTSMKIRVRYIREDMDYLIKDKTVEPYLDYVLCRTDIIAHVLVTDTVSWINNSSVSVGKYGATVKCEILDPIKGKIIPEIIEPEPLYEDKKQVVIQQKTEALPGKKIIFDYCFGWKRKSEKGEFLTMRDSTGAPWVKSGKEYILFLNLIIKCIDHNNICYYLRPNGISESSTGYLYPIENGIVISPLDDFGFGTGLTVSEFKTALRNRIEQIKNFTVANGIIDNNWREKIYDKTNEIISKNLTSVENEMPEKQSDGSLFYDKIDLTFHINNFSDKVNIELYNLLGKKVMILKENNLEAGEHSISINSENLEPGIYFVTIKSENESQTKKFIIIK